MATLALSTLLGRQPVAQEHNKLGNGTCHTIDLDSVAAPIIGDTTFHDIMIWTSLGCAIFSTIICTGLALGHIFNYREPQVQEQLIRIIITAPVFEIFCALAVWNYHISEYMLPIAKIYEAFAFVAALYLCIFLLVWSTDWQTQVQYFSLPENQGLAFFRRRYMLVTQILPNLTILSVVELIVYGYKCALDRNTRVAHVVIGVLDAVVIISAITGMLPFLRAHSEKLKASESTLWGKLLVFKGIVFIQMIQSLILAIITFTDAFDTTEYLSYNDVTRGLNPFISCCVILLLSLMMIYYYDPRRHGTKDDYTHDGKPGDYYHEAKVLDSGQTVVNRVVNPKMPAWRALWDTINMSDVFVGLSRAVKLLLKKDIIPTWSAHDAREAVG